jgi:hypothetical protein
MTASEFLKKSDIQVKIVKNSIGYVSMQDCIKLMREYAKYKDTDGVAKRSL